MKTTILFIFLITSFIQISFGQSEVLKPQAGRAVYFDVTPPLSEMRLIIPKQKRPDEIEEVPNKIGHKEFGKLKSNDFPFVEDAVWQKQDGTELPDNSAPHANFDGITNLSNIYPPDTQGDVSTDKYVQVVNSNFAVYSKTGAVLLGPAALSTIWAGIPAPWNGTNSGDPVVLYDQAADRWIITQFSIPNYTQMAELVAISATSDPTGAWYRYVFNFGTKLPDYPKFGIWSDGYYLSFNQFVQGLFGWEWAGTGACALERTKMLAGDPSAAIVYFDSGVAGDQQSMLPSDWDGANPPQAGEPNYFTYFNDWSSPTEDYLKIWAFHVDWVTTANSTFTEAISLVTSPFDSEICTATRGRCIPQPGTAIKLETLSDRLMYRMQYRNFGTHRSMVTNHTVDVDGTGHAGLRWYELRNTGSGWSIYQQGTYAPDAKHRWVGSIAMNIMGDIALGYSVSNGTTKYPSIHYTGRHANDPPGQMTIAEQTIIEGTGSQTGSAARWGDYSMMSVDPTNDRTFWFTSEYVQTTGAVTWKTRIASFLFDNTPTATTLPAAPITESTATLNGIINPNGLSTTYYFQYGPTAAYGNQTVTTPAGSIPSNQNVSVDFAGLPTGVPIHYRLVGENYDGTTYGLNKIVTPVTTVINTAAASIVSQTGATAGGEIVSDGGLTVTSRGICYGIAANPDISGSRTINGTGSGVFSSVITGLLPNTTYHIRAYAINSNGPYYGSDLTFKTHCASAILPLSESFNGTDIPSCWMQQGTAGVSNSWNIQPVAIAGGSPNEIASHFQNVIGTTRLILPPVNSLGNTQLTLSFRHALDTYFNGGLTLKVESSPDGITWTDESWSEVTTSSNIQPTLVNTTIIHNVPAAATYIALSINGNLFNYDDWYIDDVSVFGAPTVITAPVSDITLTSASTGGAVISDGGLAVTARGICYGGSLNPDISGNHTTNGAGTGAFLSSLAGLSPSASIHVRAYATNANGTAYGADVPFNTLCGTISSFPWNEGFEHGGVIPACWANTQVANSGVNWVFITGSGNGNPAAAHSGTYNACLKDVTSPDNKTHLTSPPLNLSVISAPQLKFWHTQVLWDPDQDILTVYYKTSAAGAWTLLATYSNNLTSWTEETIALPEPTADYYISFEGNAKWGRGVCIDDIQVTGIPVPVTQNIQNVSVSTGSTPCFGALQTITVAGAGTTFTVQNGGSATLVAGQNILYYPGTNVLAGGYMHGYIAPGGPFCVTTIPAVPVIAGEEDGYPRNDKKTSFTVYPNPTTGKFTLELTGIDFSEKVRVEIYGMKGEKVLAKELTERKTHDFSLSEVPAGLYFVRVVAGEKAETMKLVKY